MMKLQQVILSLQEIFNKEGNIDCVVDYEDEMGYFHLEGVNLEQDEGRKVVNFKSSSES